MNTTPIIPHIYDTIETFYAILTVEKEYWIIFFFQQRIGLFVVTFFRCINLERTRRSIKEKWGVRGFNES